MNLLKKLNMSIKKVLASSPVSSRQQKKADPWQSQTDRKFKLERLYHEKTKMGTGHNQHHGGRFQS